MSVPGNALVREFPGQMQTLANDVQAGLGSMRLVTYTGNVNVNANGITQLIFPELASLSGVAIQEWRYGMNPYDKSPAIPPLQTTVTVSPDACWAHAIDIMSFTGDSCLVRFWRPNQWNAQSPAVAAPDWSPKISCVAWGPGVGGVAPLPVPGAERAVWEIPTIIEGFAREVDGRLAASGSTQTMHIIPMRYVGLSSRGHAFISGLAVSTIHGCILTSGSAARLIAVGPNQPSGAAAQIEVNVYDASIPAPLWPSGPPGIPNGIPPKYGAIPRYATGSSWVGGIYWGV